MTLRKRKLPAEGCQAALRAWFEALIAAPAPPEAAVVTVEDALVRYRADLEIRVVAAQHDTSVVMIERNYSSLISDHADALSRAAMLDGSPLVADNVASEEAEGLAER